MKKLFTIVAFLGVTAVFAQNSETNMNVNMGSMGMDMNVNVNVTETYSESYSTSTTSNTNTSDHYVMPGYSGAIGCPWPMEESDFQSAQNSVASKDFEDSKFTVAKQITGSNCLTADQVRRMMGTFDFEQTKLDYAKFAYDKTYDIGNYYKLNDAFEFSSSIDDLNAYINGR
ncbi:MAG: DUF4476 domain-containing protein [Flavobacteriales bacterium]|nr:DUF4476 domain-containing protein [Flavobacteriales bacterium]